MRRFLSVRGYLIGASLLFLAMSPEARAQEVVPPEITTPDVQYDSSAVDVRSPGPEALRPHQTDADLFYGRDPAPPQSLWDRFWQWLDDILFRPLREVTPGWAEDWFYYLLAAIGIAFAVARLLRMDVAGAFYRKRKQAAPAFELVHEDIRGLDFDRLIDEAVAARDYRRAVRLLYLKTLKTLAARNLIDWQRDKTNHEYIDELPQPTLRRAFAHLTTLFEYVWYGDFTVDEAVYGRVRQSFIRFDKDLHAARAS